MARTLSRTLTLFHQFSINSVSSSTPSSSSAGLLAVRTYSSSHPNHHHHLTELSDVSDSSSGADPLISKLQDAIHRIMIRRAAPYWLPFVPGSSYWVPPPRSQLSGMAHLVDKLSNPPSHVDVSVHSSNISGWPSSSYFIHGAPPHPVESESTSNNASHSEEEDG